MSKLYKSFFVLLTVLGLASCQENSLTTVDTNLNLNPERSEYIRQVEMSVSGFFSDFTEVLAKTKEREASKLAEQLETRGYDVSINNNSEPMSIATEIDIYNTDLESEAFIQFLLDKKESKKVKYLESGRVEDLGAFTEVATLLKMMELYHNNDDLFANSIALRADKGKCARAVVGGFLSGGLAGCWTGVKIAGFFGPQGALTGCTLGAAVGATAAAVTAGSKYC